MKIVFLDCEYVNPGDIPWDVINNQGEFQSYYSSTKEEGIARAKDAHVVIVDKFVMDREVIEASKNLKLIAVAATGFNQIDLQAAKDNGVAVANVPAYSTDSVAQHTFALILGLTNKVRELDKMVIEEDWVKARKSVYDQYPQILLAGKSLGIVGYGNIGKKVAEIAKAFGMTVNIYSQDKDVAIKSDIVTLHCPLNDDNKEMVNEEFIGKMKDGALLINTSRGGLVDEEALNKALLSGKIAGAGLDVIAIEPASEDPKYHYDDVIITPHIAFAPKETRGKIVTICGENIEAFFKGEEKNRIV